jgi:hypothetical protein
MLISLVSNLFLIFEEGFAIRGYFPAKNWLFLPFGKKASLSETSALQFASFSFKNAHYHDYRSHLTGFCGFFCNFISLCSFTKGCIDDFDWTGLMRQIDMLKGLSILRRLSTLNSVLPYPVSIHYWKCHWSHSHISYVS